MTADLTTLPDHDLTPPAPAGLPADVLDELRPAVRALEHSTLAGRLSAMAGRPLELLGRTLPAAATEIVSRAVDMALKAALRVAVTTLPKEHAARGSRTNMALAAGSGALGGALGLPALPVELPISTTLMLRAIADIARREGEDLTDPEAALACLQVFALGGPTEADDMAQSGYFAVRGALAKSISEAARLMAGRGLADKSAPALVRFMAQIASRFGVVVSQKAVAGALPLIGALGGAAINSAFMNHYQRLAQAHFTVRRLERTHGRDAVRSAYEAIRSELDG